MRMGWWPDFTNPRGPWNGCCPRLITLDRREPMLFGLPRIIQPLVVVKPTWTRAFFEIWFFSRCEFSLSALALLRRRAINILPLILGHWKWSGYRDLHPIRKNGNLTCYYIYYIRITGTPSKPNSPCGALLFNLVPVFTKELTPFPAKNYFW